MKDTGPSDGRGKACSGCQEWKHLKEYSKQSRSVDGLRSACRSCIKQRSATYYLNNKETILDRNRRWAVDNPIKERDRHNKWNEENRERARETQRKYREGVTPEKLKEWRDRAGKKYRSTPKGKLEDAIRTGIRRGITDGSKSSRKTFTILGYSPEQLMRHLEKKFLPGMTWDNYGRNGWHIDHKIPLSVHNYETPDDEDFKRAWALKNLQPMWEPENIRKRAKLTKEFQPSLILPTPANDNTLTADKTVA